MINKILLLNSDYNVLHFISERAMIKLIVKEKVSILSSWENQFIKLGKYNLEYPAIIKMNYYIHKKQKIEWTFSRKAVFRRDKYICQFCSSDLKPGKITIDHISPKCLGGQSTFINCVAACFPCNSKKGYKTLEQSGMSLLKVPTVPRGTLTHYPDVDLWHEDWLIYINPRK